MRRFTAVLLALTVVAARPAAPSAGLPASLSMALSPVRFPPPGQGWRAAEVPDLPPAVRVGDGITLSDEEALRIGKLIWRNESGGTVDGLTHWNTGEEFASLGIGHFIWYVEGGSGPFVESFPALLSFLIVNDAAVPDWLAEARGCPWPTRAAFYKAFRTKRMNSLRAMLSATVDLQARFAAHRLEGALPKILENAPPAERPALRARFYAVAAHPRGVYALVDYVNFKGEGVSLTERYSGKGWGLLQVLEEMPDTVPGERAVSDFSASARAVLERRVALSPPARGESRWLPGWQKRVATYLAD
ncbi:hypothetical protein EPO15_03190 [bacterium]|nr:MAG: hypothetical protein EPO15_03190 [bacterium]